MAPRHRELGMSLGSPRSFSCLFDAKRQRRLLSLILIELWEVRLGEDAETSTRERVLSPD